MALFDASIRRINLSSIVEGIFPAWLGELFFGKSRALQLDLDVALETSPANGVDNLNVVLPQPLLLERSIKVHNISPRNWRDVAQLDLTNKTPLKKADVTWTLDSQRVEEGQYVRQWVAKNADLERIENQLSTLGWKPRFFLVDAGNDMLRLPYSTKGNQSGGPRFRIVNSCLMGLCLLTANYLWLNPALQARSERAKLEIEIAAQTAELIDLRQLLDVARSEDLQRTEFLDGISKRMRTSTLLRETTVFLPDSTWLSEWRQTGNQLRLSGETDSSAASLVLRLSEKAKGWTPALSGAVSRTASGAEKFTLDVVVSERSQ
jgi:hypothetical protein